jgi:hypothetical protein
MSDDLVVTETMDSTPKVDNKMMASFRIDRDAWKRFGEMARRERLTVTELITDYVEKCLAAERSWYGVEMGTDEMSIDRSDTSIGTGDDSVLKQVEALISTSKDEILMLVEEKISIAISTLSLSHRSDTRQSQNKTEIGTKPLPKRTRPEGAIDRSEIVKKLGKSRQTIETRRDKGTLAEWGYRAEKIDGTWWYFSIEQTHQQ